MSGDFSDLSVPMQLRVYLEANPQIKEYLGSEGLARTVKASLAGEVPLIPVATISNYWPTYKLQFTVLFGVMLLGFMAGVGAIVGERPVLLREVPSGLRPDAYVASRFALAGFILLVQTLAGVVPLNLMFDASHQGLRKMWVTGWVRDRFSGREAAMGATIFAGLAR